jgi:phospholipase C
MTANADLLLQLVASNLRARLNSINDRACQGVIAMRKTIAALAVLMVLSGNAPAATQYHFQHIIVIVQENRTPDNLFYGLCSYVTCSTTPTSTQYDIQTSNWFDKTSPGGVIQPASVSLATTWGPGHAHSDYVTTCDANSLTGVCAMDGANGVLCQEKAGGCPAKMSFMYVENTKKLLHPYFLLAGEYGWANYMFQTNQGPSYPAHQFLFGGTSAPTAEDDQKGTFVSENPIPNDVIGCAGPPNQTVQLIDGKGLEAKKNTVFPCFERTTLSDLLDDNGISWRYYAVNAPGYAIWNAPNSIQHICVANAGACTGSLYTGNVDLSPPDVLSDISNCNLRDVSWVTPDGGYSDHAGNDSSGGPDWVASIVNAVGASTCKNKDKSSYWNSTAILITWDDWGGWYDHEPPTLLGGDQGGYQYGMRVPLIFVSAYTPPAFISNTRYDFGSMLRTIEHNFKIPEGSLGFADKRSKNDLSAFYSFALPPRAFTAIPTVLKAKDFLNDKRPRTAPDDD